MKFEKFFEELMDKNQMTDAESDGTIRYTWDEDFHITIELDELAEMLSDEQVSEMLDRGSWYDADNAEEINAILESEQSWNGKLVDLTYDGYLRQIFDDIALSDAEASNDFKNKMRAFYEEVNYQSVKESRQKIGMTQKEFASFIDIPLRTIENWESGHRKPPVYVEKLIAYKVNAEFEDDR